MRTAALLASLVAVSASRLTLVENLAGLGGVQLPWSADTPAADVLTPASDVTLSSVTDEFTVLTSPLHPKHRVRIKSTNGWCDPHARSYSGYIDTGDGKELFFNFFESRDKPDKDPVVMWINGGPGGSSAMGLFMELGPCTVNDNPKSRNDTTPNPHSWNNHANIFFLDQPVGVGYSYAEHGQTVSTTEEAAVDVAAFVSIFFQSFKEFEGRAFHMTGESYGGRYLPIFASAVYDNNAVLAKAGKKPVNLDSIMIGNGMTDWLAVMESYFPFMCERHVDLGRSVMPISGCVAMAQSVPKCDKLARKGCLETKDHTECSIATAYCQLTLMTAFLEANVNPYDVSMPCTPEEYSSHLCYPATVKITDYLNLPDVRAFLGVSDKVGDHHSIAWDVNQAFTSHLDMESPTWLYIPQLLERGVRVLIYVGTLDYICNYIGNADWLERLEWRGKAKYNAAKQRDWHHGGKVAGFTKSGGNLTFATVYGAGHMVPMDKPKQSAALFESFLRAEGVPK